MMNALAGLSYFSYFLLLLALLKFSFSNRNFSLFLSLLFLFILTGIRPLIVLLNLDVLIPYDEFQFGDGSDILLTNLVLILWVFVLFAGYSNFFTRIYKPAIIESKHNDGKDYYFLSAVTLLVVCLYFTLNLISQAGSVGAFMYMVKVEKALKGLYVFRDLMLVSTALICISIFTFKSSKHLLLVKFFTLLAAMVGVYLWGNRTGIAYMLIILIVFYISKFDKIPVYRVALGLLVGAFLLQFLKILRESSVAASLDATDEIYSFNNVWTKLSLSLHMSEYDGLALALRDAGDRFDFRYGEDFFNGLVAWIPRFLWEDKPGTFFVGKWFRQVYQPEIINGWPITPIGSWYVNFSFLGVILGAFLTGILLKYLDVSFPVSRERQFIALYATTFTIGAGVDTGFVQSIFLTLLPVLLVLYYKERKHGN